MPSSSLKKCGLILCALLLSTTAFLVHAEPLALGADTLLSTELTNSTLWMSLGAGMLLALLIYNFLLFLSLRNISYFYYALLTSAVLFSFGSFNGLWLELLWHNKPPHWYSLSLPIGLTLAGAFSAQFSRSFFSTASKFPKLDKAFYRLGFAFFLTLIASLFISLTYALYAITALFFILSITAVVASINSSLKANYASQMYLIAWLMLLFGASLFIAHHFGWIPDIWIARHTLTIGGMLYIVLLSFALTYRIIITHRQTTEFHKQIAAEGDAKIAEQVIEQTKELTQLNEKLHQQEDVLKKLAFYDSLTGLANRTFIQEQLKQLLLQSKRNKTKLAVLLLDLDDFKPINDEHGHKVGDEVLTTTANRLRATLRESDVVGRLGCDKFIVVLESFMEDKHDPKEVADKIRMTISQAMPIDWFILHIGASIGIAYYPNDGSDAESLISAADSAMRIDKSKKESRRQ